MRRWLLLPVAVLTLGMTTFAGPPPAVTEWLETPGGRLKARVFPGWDATSRPVLIVVLHGDSPFSRPSYQYDFAGRIAARGDVVTAAILRPGYTDPAGDRSSGEQGFATGDNYTVDRIDMLAAAVARLQARHHPRETILVGHSGGAVLAANLLALHPALADRAVLVSCPCDVPGWRAHMRSVRPGPLWLLPVKSVSPMDTAERVPVRDRVVMLVGGADEIAPPRFTEAYAARLRARRVAVTVRTLPGRGHEILLDHAVGQAVAEMLPSRRQAPGREGDAPVIFLD